ncbi:hypothetical protein N340_06937, partial [Tauraco erythrolophus]
WPLPLEKLRALHDLIERELQCNHIEESTSPWNTPVFVIKKKDKSKFRFLHDLRAVNRQMEDMGPLQPGLPIASAIPVHWPVVVMDIKDCFFSIPLHPEDCQRFAFSIPSINLQEPAKRYQWRVLPQGMKNSPVICQKTVVRVLQPVRDNYPQATIIHYMDDILISTSSKERLSQLETAVKEHLTMAGLDIQEAKTQQGDKIHYLGSVIQGPKVYPQEIRLETDIKTLHDAQKLVGSLQWLRNAIGIPPYIMAPLYDLL